MRVQEEGRRPVKSHSTGDSYLFIFCLLRIWFDSHLFNKFLMAVVWEYEDPNEPCLVRFLIRFKTNAYPSIAMITKIIMGNNQSSFYAWGSVSSHIIGKCATFSTENKSASGGLRETIKISTPLSRVGRNTCMHDTGPDFYPVITEGSNKTMIHNIHCKLLLCLSPEQQFNFSLGPFCVFAFHIQVFGNWTQVPHIPQQIRWRSVLN